MKPPFDRWLPRRDPVHKFLLLFDTQAVMVAAHRWQPDVQPGPDQPPKSGQPAKPCPPPDPAAHPSDIVSAEHIVAARDEAVAALARLGQPEAGPAAVAAAGLMIRFGETYGRHPCPCVVCRDCGNRFPAQPCDFVISVEYTPIRQALLHHLALGGRAVPPFIRMRGARLSQLLRAPALPTDPHAALRRSAAEVFSSWPPQVGRTKWKAADLRRVVERIVGAPGPVAGPLWTLIRTQDSTREGIETYQGFGHAAGTFYVGPPEVVEAIVDAFEAVADQLPESPPPAEVAGPTEIPALRPAHRAILAALRKAGRPLTGKRLAAAAGYKPGTLRRHTGPLQNKGLIRRCDSGYELTAEGVAVIDRVTAHTPLT